LDCAICRRPQGIALADALAQELKDAASGQGNASKKRDDTHKMAQANARCALQVVTIMATATMDRKKAPAKSRTRRIASFAERTRNIGIAAPSMRQDDDHRARSVLHRHVHKMGEVHEAPPSPMDGQERERGITITSAATDVHMGANEKKKVFTRFLKGQAARHIMTHPATSISPPKSSASLRVLDGAIAVF